MEVVALLSQGRTAAAQCGLFTYKSVSVIFEPPCSLSVSVALSCYHQYGCTAVVNVSSMPVVEFKQNLICSMSVL